jgi:3-phenylpropionate/trans-cinnamate dioxygenase ferredoxin subunit
MAERELIAVMPMAEVEPGALYARTIGELEVLVCRLDDGVHAVENRCTHGASRLEAGRFRNGEVTCPLHGARFSVRTGKAMCAPARVPIKVFEVVEEGGTLHIVKPAPPPPRQKFGPLG